MKKTIIILIILAVLAALGLVIFSLRDTRILDRGIKKISPPKIEETKPFVPPERKLVPQRPEDYGMIVTDEKSAPVTEQQWDLLIKNEVRKLKTRYPPEIWDKVQQKIKEEPAVTAQKLKDIGENIKKCREILKNEPNNAEIKQKLERLMILKSIGEELPSRE